TLKRWKELQEAQQKEKDEKRKKSEGKKSQIQKKTGSSSLGFGISDLGFRPRYFGTVGTVALDRNGNLAAGTATGGMTNKRPGRLGDSPIIGAGTYADNEACGVSCTGHGEFFIRYAVAHDIVALVKYKGLSVQQAADEVIKEKLGKVNGEGAVIVLDTKGNVAVSFNSERMFRGWITEDGKVHIVAFHEKPTK